MARDERRRGWRATKGEGGGARRKLCFIGLCLAGCCSLYLFSYLSPLKVEARFPGHTPELSRRFVYDSELVGFVTL